MFLHYPKVCTGGPSTMRQRVLECIDSVNMQSSPGAPLMWTYPTNATVIEAFGRELLADVVMTRIRCLEEMPLCDLMRLSALELLEGNFTDLTRIFVKDELHSLSKMTTGRMRLIMSVSLIDQLVVRALNAMQTKAEIADWEELQSMPGMGLHDHGLEVIQRRLEDMPHACGTDVPAFDFGVAGWELMADARLRMRLNGWADGDLPLKATWCEAMKTLLTSGGEVCAQTEPGVRSSGGPLTSGGNSHNRHARALHVQGNDVEVMAMGDDCLESNKQRLDLKYAYAEKGFKLKIVEPFEPDGAEFCSYQFRRGFEPRPVRWHKMLGSFLYTWPTKQCFEERLVALKYELRHSEHLQRCVDTVMAIRAKLDGGLQ